MSVCAHARRPRLTDDNFSIGFPMWLPKKKCKTSAKKEKRKKKLILDFLRDLFLSVRQRFPKGLKNRTRNSFTKFSRLNISIYCF